MALSQFLYIHLKWIRVRTKVIKKDTRRGAIIRFSCYMENVRLQNSWETCFWNEDTVLVRVIFGLNFTDTLQTWQIKFIWSYHNLIWLLHYGTSSKALYDITKRVKKTIQVFGDLIVILTTKLNGKNGCCVGDTNLIL